MDWTIAGVLLALVALVSGWFWWWQPRQARKDGLIIGNVTLGKLAKSGSISTEVGLDNAVEADAGNVELGSGAQSRDITTKVTTKKSGQ